MATSIYETVTGYCYAITTGQSSDVVLVGEGPTFEAAMDARQPTAEQSAGGWNRERDLAVIARACNENLDSLKAAIKE